MVVVPGIQVVPGTRVAVVLERRGSEDDDSDAVAPQKLEGRSSPADIAEAPTKSACAVPPPDPSPSPVDHLGEGAGRQGGPLDQP